MENESNNKSDTYLKAINYYAKGFNSNLSIEDLSDYIEEGTKYFQEALSSNLDFKEWMVSKLNFAELLMGGPFLNNSLNDIRGKGIENNEKHSLALQNYEEALRHDINTGFTFFSNALIRAEELNTLDWIYVMQARFLKDQISMKTAKKYLDNKLTSFSAPDKLFGHNPTKSAWIFPKAIFYLVIYSNGKNWFLLEMAVDELCDRLNALNNDHYLYNDYNKLLDETKSLMDELRN